MNSPRKVLVITYYWPPAGGPGVQRVLKFVKYLPEFGWRPIVLTVKKGEFPALDETLLQDIPVDCLVHKTNSFEPNLLYKKFIGLNDGESIPVAVLAEKKPGWKKRLSNWLRLTFFVPDAKIGWMPYAVKAGTDIIKKEKPDLILSSSPPPTVHLIARGLAKRHKLKWVADFRDPWTGIHYYQRQSRFVLSERFDHDLEQQVLQDADQIITVSKSVERELQRKMAPRRCTVIYNGFDADDFKNLVAPRQSDKFTLAYTGSFKANQNPDDLWAALQDLARNDDFKTHFKLHLTGNVHEAIKDSLERYQLSQYVMLEKYVPHTQAISNMRNSAALLFIIPDAPDNKGILTGKLFEYLAIQC